jgi:hypothetical protein
MSKNSKELIFSDEIISKYEKKLNKLEIEPTEKNIINLIKKHENLKNPKILSYVQPDRPVNPITVSRYLSKMKFDNDDVVKKIAEEYQNILIKNAILQEEALRQKGNLEARLKALMKDNQPKRLIFRPSSSSSSSSSNSQTAQSARPTRGGPRSIQRRRDRSRSARRSFGPFN